MGWRMMLTDEEFRLFRTLIYEESGMFLKEAKKDFLENRLAKRMQATNMTHALLVLPVRHRATRTRNCWCSWTA